jgi:predicted transposase YbfD/YdcC
MGESVQGHGAVEHSRHGVRAIALREDDSRIRKGNAPEHVARRRQIAVNLLTPERTTTHGGNATRNRAGWANDDLVTVLGI